jgi:starch-binding outer membrane protein, SusD/RagB family
MGNRTKVRMLAAALALLLVLPACDSLLDIEPRQTVSPEQALGNQQGVQTALRGAYSALGDYYMFGGQYIMLPDLLADDGDLTWAGTFSQPREAFQKALLTDNSFVALMWTRSFRAINIANNVLDGLDLVENAAVRARIEGEAKFIRGLVYFQLAQMYGRAWNDGDPSQNLAVPLVTQPTRVITTEDRIPRATVAQVYAQAVSDLVEARELLPVANSVFANTYAASAILARAYLAQGQNLLAAQEADRVIESGRFRLMDEFSDAFNRSTNVAEYIFAIQVTPQDAGDRGHSLSVFYAAPPVGRGDIDIEEQHLDRYEEGDARGAFFYIDEEFDVWRTGKWEFGTADGANIPVIRLAEMYLIRAEANLRGGTAIGQSPVNDINMIRARAGLDGLGSVTLADIFRERRLELAFEGHLLFDAKRFQENVGTIPWNANRLVFPVPQREMDANPNLTQNPGYGN